MRKAMFMCFLFAFGYFGFSTLPFTEVSAQTLTIASGNSQSTTRGAIFTNGVTLNARDAANDKVSGAAVSTTVARCQISLSKTGTFVGDPGGDTDDTFYVKANASSLYDTCTVTFRVTITPVTRTVTFTGTITDVLNFSADTATRSVAENTAANTNIGTAVSATHWANEDTDTTNDVTLGYSLEGTDAGSFSIESTTGQLKTSVPLDYETKTTYSVTVKVKEESGGTVRSSDTIDVTINVTDLTIPAPTGLQASVSNGQVTLSWAAPSSTITITGYKYSKDNGVNWASAGTSTSYVVTGLTNGTSYTFKVRAIGTNEVGTASNSLTAIPKLSPPAAPTGLTATVGDGQITLNWTAPSGPITRYDYSQDGGTWTSTGGTSTSYIVKNLTNGTQYAFRVRAVNSGGNGAASASVTGTPMKAVTAPAAPTGLTATPGDGKITLNWTAPSGPITHYEYSQNGGAWTSTSSTGTTYIVTNLTNGTQYAFRVRAVNSVGDGTASASTTATPVLGAPPPNPDNTPLPLVETNPPTIGSLTVKRTDNPTVTLSWSIPTTVNAPAIIEYQYSIDAGQTWTSTGSRNTAITITGDGASSLSSDKFKVRAVSLNVEGTARVVTFILFAPAKRRTQYECPVGWTRGSVFGKTKKALIYELQLDVDRTNRVSIYQLKSLAIYVHPDEGLETLDGWTLKVGTLYNNFGQEFKLTAENSVIGEHDFAHIKNPEDTPIPMSALGFIGQSLPSFDYRLYDAQGVRVDLGISCYKEGGLTYRLWNTKDPRVIRVLPLFESEEGLKGMMRNLNWDSLFFRTQWTAAIMPDLPDAPGAPSLVKKNIVGTWGDLKKQ